MAQKTDIIGVGSDDGKKMPRILGSHTIVSGVAYPGTRFINMMFRGASDDTTHIFSLGTLHDGIEFIGCKFMATGGAAGQTLGITATLSHDLKIIGCTFDRGAIGNEGFTTAAINIGTGVCYYLAIIGNNIDSGIGIVIHENTIPTGGIIADNVITAATLTIDDNSDKYYICLLYTSPSPRDRS